MCFGSAFTTKNDLLDSAFPPFVQPAAVVGVFLISTHDVATMRQTPEGREGVVLNVEKVIAFACVLFVRVWDADNTSTRVICNELWPTARASGTLCGIS